MALATGILAARAGRDEIRYGTDLLWATEAFLAYAMFVAMVLLPVTLYFYLFYGDWFLMYLVDTGRAIWMWGALSVLSVVGFAALGFRLGAALCGLDRQRLAGRLGVGIALLGLIVWPSGWPRLARVGSYRQFTRDYGLLEYPSSTAFYSGALMALLVLIAFVWVLRHIDGHSAEGY